MKIPRIEDADIAGKKVLLRADLDVGENDEGLFRLKALIPTLKFLKDKDCDVILIGHKGRPGGKEVEKYSLEPVSKRLEDLLGKEWGEEEMKKLKMNMMENLRFSEGEENNDDHYAMHLAEEGEFYVNEDFAVSHREHASIVGLPKYLPHAAGIRFMEEIDNLSKVFNAEGPIVVIIGGVKEDKTNYIEGLKGLADKVLVAGRLPDYLPEDINDPKLVVAKLIPDKEDITVRSIEMFADEIAQAKTIIVAGPMGKYEEDGHGMGTERVLTLVSETQAMKISCGGDTANALHKYGLVDKFDWVSVGGGASLEFLIKRALPGIDALLN
jgi:phosphoglycerate kinase